ncbi:MAG: DinB family protein [Anaerolineae bacterium]|nr:DinB family protein [Anaerolineae bacterium]
MQQLAHDMRAVVTKAAAQLRKVDDSTASHRPGPEEWSAKEILGHLIDSAGNNHQRFVRAQSDEDHSFPSYDPDDWVALQAYQAKDWHHLITLWEVYNLHLAEIIECIPEDKLETTCLLGGDPWTLQEIIIDYLGHMQMHLGDLPVGVSDIKRYPYPKARS